MAHLDIIVQDSLQIPEIMLLCRPILTISSKLWTVEYLIWILNGSEVQCQRATFKADLITGSNKKYGHWREVLLCTEWPIIQCCSYDFIVFVIVVVIICWCHWFTFFITTLLQPYAPPATHRQKMKWNRKGQFAQLHCQKSHTSAALNSCSWFSKWHPSTSLSLSLTLRYSHEDIYDCKSIQPLLRTL